MINFLKRCDTFFQEEHLLITHSLEEGKSVFGGIISIILYSLSLSFFLYSITDWLQDNKLPKITFDVKNTEKLEYQNSDILAQFEYYRTYDDEIDPLDPNNQILQVILEYKSLENLNIEEQLQYSQQMSKANTYSIILQNVYLSFDVTGEQIKFIDYTISFRECKDKFLKPGQKCANQILIDQFYSQKSKWLTITFYEQQFNSKSKQLIRIPKRNSIFLQQNKTFYQETILQIARSQIDTGLLLSNVNYQQFLSSTTNQIYEVPQEVPQQFYGVNVPLIMNINLGQLYTEQYIEYPKFQEILADVGSIVSLLWFIQIFPQIYNKKLLERTYLNEIIKLYYSDFDDLKVKFSFLGKISQIEYQGQLQCGQNFEIWNKIYQRLMKTAKKKSSYIGLLYEVSRLQLLFLQQLIQNSPISEMKINQYFQEAYGHLQNNQIQQSNDFINISEDNLNLQKNDFNQLCIQSFNKPFKLNSIHIQ